MAEEQRLKRSLTLPMVFLYGLGTTIGAGIYALTGEVAAKAGMYAPLSFTVASLLAALTAASFAELASRYPRSAGEAVYVREGLGLARLATVVGLLVALAGSVSAATMTVGFVGYLDELIDVQRLPAMLLFALALGGLAAWGIDASVRTAAAITVVETTGLVWIVWGARAAFAELPARAGELLPGFSLGEIGAVSSGALLAFYAFLGFEDMVNVAEEVRDVERTLPKAIALTLTATLLVYAAVVTAAVLAVDPVELAASAAPLSLVHEAAGGRAPTAISVIALLALVNGCLVQVIMASRVLYGLAEQRALPAWLSHVHPRTRTPVRSTALVTGIVAVLAVWLPLAELAAVTSVITLLVFSLVNAALVRVKKRGPAPANVWTCPRWIPAAGLCVSIGFFLFGVVRLLTSH